MKRVFFACLLTFLASFSFAQHQTGKASFYSDKYEGHVTASGEKYKHSKFTAAHKTLPFGTRVRVTNIENNQSVEVVVNDRGPYVDGRIIDLSKAAAEKLGYFSKIPYLASRPNVPWAELKPEFEAFEGQYGWKITRDVCEAFIWQFPPQWRGDAVSLVKSLKVLNL